MGWSGGSSLLEDVWERVRSYVPESARVEVLAGLMKDFSNRDCDTLAEVICDDWPESEPAYEQATGCKLDDEDELDTPPVGTAQRLAYRCHCGATVIRPVEMTPTEARPFARCVCGVAIDWGVARIE